LQKLTDLQRQSKRERHRVREKGETEKETQKKTKKENNNYRDRGEDTEWGRHIYVERGELGKRRDKKGGGEWE
jgi:hypothetical protein